MCRGRPVILLVQYVGSHNTASPPSSCSGPSESICTVTPVFACPSLSCPKVRQRQCPCCTSKRLSPRTPSLHRDGPPRFYPAHNNRPYWRVPIAASGMGKPMSRLLIELIRASCVRSCGGRADASALCRIAPSGERVSNVAVRASAAGDGALSRAAEMSDTSKVALRACLPGAAGTAARRDSIDRSTSRARASASTALRACGFAAGVPIHLRTHERTVPRLTFPLSWYVSQCSETQCNRSAPAFDRWPGAQFSTRMHFIPNSELHTQRAWKAQ